MSSGPKQQRIRDPIHNLITFGTDDFDSVLWQVVQTPEFQRLRRIRQLGFSEFVYPGATHTRFAHSLGVFHTARQLMQVVERHLGTQTKQDKLRRALAATLVHDVGHGMFSHAFEEVGNKLKLPMAHHETVSEALIKSSEIGRILSKEFGTSFEKDVADLVKSGTPQHLYHTVVSSQFDADRLDYMQRDRKMTGVQSSGIDLTWLIENLEIVSVPVGSDEVSLGSVDTFALGPKAFYAAESYVLALFQLYPNVYFHKTTRAAEKLFGVLMVRIIELVRDGQIKAVGLPENHPIVRFALAPHELERALALDDTVFWGALPMLIEAEDRSVALWSKQLWSRKLPKCIDVGKLIEHEKLKHGRIDDPKVQAEIRVSCQRVTEEIGKVAGKRSAPDALILVDQVRRTPYKKKSVEGKNNPLNQILIRQAGGAVRDMAEISPVVANAQTFEVCRCYVYEDDAEGRSMVENIMRTELSRKADVDA